MTNDEKLFCDICQEILDSGLNPDLVTKKAQLLAEIVYQKRSRSLFLDDIAFLDEMWVGPIPGNPLIDKIKFFLELDHGISLSNEDIFIWIVDDDHEVREILNYCSINENSNLNDCMDAIHDKVGYKGNVDEVIRVARKNLTSVIDSKIDWFWKWYDRSAPKDDTSIVNLIRCTYGSRGAKYKDFNEKDISSLYTAETVGEFMDNPIIQDMLHTKRYLEIRFTIPLIPRSLIEMDCDRYSNFRIVVWNWANKSHSHWNQFVNDSKSGKLDIKKMASELVYTYFERVKYTRNIIPLHEMEKFLTLRSNLDYAGSYMRVSDYINNILDRTPPIPVAIPGIEKVMPDLLKVRERMLISANVDLSIFEVIYLICEMYFELDWIVRRDEWEAFEEHMVIPPSISKDDLESARNILQTYYEFVGLRSNPFAEMEFSIRFSRYVGKLKRAEGRAVRYVRAIEDPKLCRLIRGRYGWRNYPDDKGSRRMMEEMCTPTFKEDTPAPDKNKKKKKKARIRAYRKGEYFNNTDLVHGLAYSSCDPAQPISKRAIVDSIAEYYGSYIPRNELEGIYDVLNGVNPIYS